MQDDAVPSVDPPPSSWGLEAPPDDHPHDLWAVGADLEPGTLLAAYRLSLFPMPMGPRLGWFSPRRRAIVPLDAFRRPSRSLRRAARRFEIRFDTAFADVVAGCARPGDPHSWIDGGVAAAYCRLHELGWAHSVEAWDAEGLAGGLYGVSIGGLFLAGVLPGVLIALSLMATVLVYAKLRKYPVYARASLREFGTALFAALLPMLTPAINPCWSKMKA